MSRVLLVCPEPLARGRRAGVGIRFVEMARVLRGAGHEVSVLSADGGQLEGCISSVASPEALAAFSARADVAVVQGHIANDLFAHGRALPTVVDLYDPYIVENLHYYGERGPEVFQHDHATIVRSLARGDLFLCASQAQRFFYLGMLLAIGRLNPLSFERDPRAESLVRIAPFGVQPRATPPAANLTQREILFGGIYDWYDPVLAVEAVRLARERVPQLSLTFNTHPNAELPQGKAAEALTYVRKYGLTEFIHFRPWVDYESRSPFFQRFAAALLTFPESLETDLSMRTRVYDYLWAGLPIVTSSAPGSDEILTAYDAGVVIRGSDPSRFADALVAIVSDESRHRRMVEGTQKFVDDHQWERALAPLLAFCRDPKVDPDRDRFTAVPQAATVPPTFAQRIRRKLRAIR